MLAAEKRMIAFLRRHMLVIGFVLVLLFSLALRYLMRTNVSIDTRDYGLPWMESLETDGFFATLRHPGFNYNVLYLCMLYLVTLIPLPFGALGSIKVISIVFDYLMAGALAWLLLALLPKEAKNRRKMALAMFALASILPIPMLNSAMWGQCDSIYAFFCIVCLGLMLKEKYTLAFFMFAIAFCFKMQAIFILPVLIILYVVKQRFSLVQFLQAPALLFLLGLVARSPGDSLFFGFEIYLDQTDHYGVLSMNYPNLYVGIDAGFYDLLVPILVLAAVCMFMCMLVYIVVQKYDIQGDTLILLVIWSVFTCTCILPAMHDRYAYIGEVLLWLFFMARPCLKRFALAFCFNAVTLLIYTNFLLKEIVFSVFSLGLLNMLLYVVLTAVLIGYLKKTNGPAGIGKGVSTDGP